MTPSSAPHLLLPLSRSLILPLINNNPQYVVVLWEGKQCLFYIGSLKWNDQGEPPDSFYILIFSASHESFTVSAFRRAWHFSDLAK